MDTRPAEAGRWTALGPMVLAGLLMGCQGALLVRADIRALGPGETAHLARWLSVWWVPGVVSAGLVWGVRRRWTGTWRDRGEGLAWGLWLPLLCLTPLVQTLGAWGLEHRAVNWAVAVGLWLFGVALGRRAWMGVVPACLAAVIWTAPPVLDSAPVDAPPPEQPPILLLTLDTLRADHVGAVAGSDSPSDTPALDGLAERGVLFTQGVAPAPLTSPAHAGFLTGRPPTEVGMLRNGDVLDSEIRTVTESLRRQGWRTGAFVSSVVLDRRYGLSRGFERYDDRFESYARVAMQAPWSTLYALGLGQLPGRRRAGRVTIERALDWLHSGEANGTFLWVHLYDAHGPYEPQGHPSDKRRLGPYGTPSDLAFWSNWRERHYPGPKLGFGFFDDRMVRPGVWRYAGGVSHLDALIAQLIEGLPEGTRIVVASDHGESLSEHGYSLNHGRHIYQATSRVPLWVVDPEAPESGLRVEHPVPSWLVGPTLLNLAGEEAGPDLVHHARAPFPDPIVSFTRGQESRLTMGLGQTRPELAWRVGGQKWLARAQYESVWLFDLDVDPDEAYPTQVSEQDPMHNEVLKALTDLQGVRTQDAGDEKEWLEMLGYVD